MLVQEIVAAGAGEVAQMGEILGALPHPNGCALAKIVRLLAAYVTNSEDNGADAASIGASTCPARARVQDGVPCKCELHARQACVARRDAGPCSPPPFLPGAFG